MRDGEPQSARKSDVRRLAVGIFSIGLLMLVAGTVSGQDIEHQPINYSSAKPRNAVARLQEKVIEEKAHLEYEPDHGYLRSLLRSLEIPESSQVLVFSKTSLQRERISPKTPRAIYFNDEVMVGFCLQGRVIEISAADEVIGTAYYTLDQRNEVRAVPERQTDSCLLCHSSSANRGMPGHLVRSLFVDRQGNPLLSSPSFRTDHSSPLAERWGGWYVTGTSGSQKHMGNMVFQERRPPRKLEAYTGLNVVDLKDRLTISLYPTPHSDIVALMVLEHQVGMLNRLARAGIETRMAIHEEQESNRLIGRKGNSRSETAKSRIHGVAEAIVQYMLMRDETRLTGRIKGTSAFSVEFVARGPRDRKGRSLRDLDLESRLFRYPCSYLIYSRAFDSLPGEVKDEIYRRLWEILNGQGGESNAPRLTTSDREAILEILADTKPGLPDYWTLSARDTRPQRSGLKLGQERTNP